MQELGIIMITGTFLVGSVTVILRFCNWMDDMRDLSKEKNSILKGGLYNEKSRKTKTTNRSNN